MSEPDTLSRPSAGGLLRAARERQGLHIAALAAAIKVTPRKLDALEHDRYNELPDPAFTRALAQTVCRSLKIDPAPVLALLPPAGPASLEHVAGSLNTPFRERSGRDEQGLAASAIRPLIWASGVLMVAAVAVMLLPERWWEAFTQVAPATTSAASAAVATGSAPASAVAAVAASVAEATSAAASVAAAVVGMPASAVVETVFSAPPLATGASAPASATMLSIRVSDTSWIEVQDGRGSVLLSRSVQAGESVGLDGNLPLRLTIGNAAGTQLLFRGRAVDLAPSIRDNVARLELK